MGVNISAPYIYVCTRMRVRKAKLLPREEYMRMLNMSIPEITRIIEETEYKQEIDELGTTFKGIDLVEVALSWNLAKEYQKIQEITPGTLKAFTRAYLRRWDIQNVLTIMRGRVQGEKTGRIKEILIPAGSLDKVMLDRLLAEESNDRIIELLKGHRMFPVLAQEYPAAKESGSFSHMENELYKASLCGDHRDAKAGIKGGASFLSYIQPGDKHQECKDPLQASGRYPGRGCPGDVYPRGFPVCNGFCKPECDQGPERIHRPGQGNDPERQPACAAR